MKPTSYLKHHTKERSKKATSCTQNDKKPDTIKRSRGYQKNNVEKELRNVVTYFKIGA